MKLTTLQILVIIPFLSVLPGCTTVRESGKVVFSTSSDIRGLHFRTAAGTQLDAELLDNSTVHNAVGTEVSKGIISTGTAIMTSGVTQYLH